MENEISIQKVTVLDAYKRASEEQKKVLENIFGKDIFKPKDITERIKTFEDAYEELGEDNDLVGQYRSFVRDTMKQSDDVIAYLKLKIIVSALNEGRMPMNEIKEYLYYPMFCMYTKEEYEELNEDEKKECYIVYLPHHSSSTNTYIALSWVEYGFSNFNPRLALKTRKLAEYCGKQFIDIWADYLF